MVVIGMKLTKSGFNFSWVTWLYKWESKSSKEKFRVVVCKNIHAIANAGFSIKNVNCRSCGGSFDATREHNCPYCGNPYHLGNDDWVVIEFNKE